jgi:ubiquinone biosynthesis protein
MGDDTHSSRRHRPRSTEAESGLLAGFETAPNLVRILRVFVRHGFLGALRGTSHWPSPSETREAFEELGVVFLKFGQVLAVRRDLLPDDYIAELERLHDQLPPMGFETVREAIQHELGGPPDTLFASFDRHPVAAATIAQVHAATLPDGRRVAVKVRRPDIADRIETDVATLTYLAALVERIAPRLRLLDLVGMVREFRASLSRELDFRIEARSIQRFRQACADVQQLWIPDVVLERTSAGVLTMEFSPGLRIDQYAAQHPDERGRLAQTIATILLHQVFETGLFHADPHPGNVFVMPDGRICLHDFGNVGELPRAMREGLIDLLDAAVRGDAAGATDSYLALGLVGMDVDRAALEASIGAIVRDLHERPLADISIGDAFQSLVRIGSQHRVRNPGEILLLGRAFLVAEAVMRQLDPKLNVVEAFQREATRVMRLRYAPGALRESALQLARQIERLLQEAPSEIRRTLHRVADGELGQIRAPGLETMTRRASRDVERLTGAVASAAFVVGGAMLTTIPGWHRSVGDALLAVGVLGTLAVALGALRRRSHT